MNDTNVLYRSVAIPHHGTNVQDLAAVHPEGRTSNYADLEHDNIRFDVGQGTKWISYWIMVVKLSHISSLLNLMGMRA